MQTFLPYADFALSAKCLDRQRLGKQRVETLQILNALLKPGYGWQNHPAVKMWQGHETMLCLYGIAICNEWTKRGYKDTCAGKIWAIFNSLPLSFLPPDWLCDETFHASHRAALLFKNFAHYSQFGWTEEPKLDYFWPTTGGNMERFSNYNEAYQHAKEQAKRLQMDMAICAKKEYGKKGFNVHIASKHDSDYARFEIVTPKSF